MNKKVVAGAVAASMLAIGSVQAEGIGLGVKGGTQGVGAEIGYKFSEKWNARLGFNTFSRSYSETIDDINYDIDADLKSTNLFVDWHPFSGIFRFTGGYVSNATSFDVEARQSSATLSVGDTDYVVAGNYGLDGEIDYGGGVYLGLGWGDIPAKGLGFTADIGVFAMGKPDISLDAVLDAEGVISQSDLDKEAASMEDDAEIPYYPVISVGLSYGF